MKRWDGLVDGYIKWCESRGLSEATVTGIRIELESLVSCLLPLRHSSAGRRHHNWETIHAPVKCPIGWSTRQSGQLRYKHIRNQRGTNRWDTSVEFARGAGRQGCYSRNKDLSGHFRGSQSAIADATKVSLRISISCSWPRLTVGCHWGILHWRGKRLNLAEETFIGLCESASITLHWRRPDSSQNSTSHKRSVWQTTTPM